MCQAVSPHLHRVNRQMQVGGVMWVGSLSNDVVRMWSVEASWLVLLFCECLLPVFGSEARMYSL